MKAYSELLAISAGFSFDLLVPEAFREQIVDAPGFGQRAR